MYVQVFCKKTTVLEEGTGISHMLFSLMNQFHSCIKETESA